MTKSLVPACLTLLVLVGPVSAQTQECPPDRVDHCPTDGELGCEPFDPDLCPESRDPLGSCDVNGSPCYGCPYCDFECPALPCDPLPTPCLIVVETSYRTNGKTCPGCPICRNHPGFGLDGPTGTVDTAYPSFYGNGCSFEVVDQVEVREGDAVLCTAQLPASGCTWGCTSTVALADGPHTVAAWVRGPPRDGGAAGEQQSNPLTLTVETLVPTAVSFAAGAPPVLLYVGQATAVEVEVRADGVPLVGPGVGDVLFTAVQGETTLPLGTDTDNDGDGRFITTWAPDESLLGTWTIQAVYSGCDDVAASMAETTTVVSRDTAPPVLTLPGALTLEAGTMGYRVVTYAVTASDNATAAPVVSCTPESGSLFALGLTNVACTATDEAGNTGTGSFTVRIQDTRPPLVRISVAKQVTTTNPDGAVVTFSASAQDVAAGQRPVSCTPASGSLFRVGTTGIRCSASDLSGNTGVASASVKVVYRAP
ncbi:MAG: HYR domain-containing protein [Myxococcota bacterium]